MNFTAVSLVCIMIVGHSAAPAYGRDQTALLACMEEHRGLPPILRTDTCLCIADRVGTIKSRLQHFFARDAVRADANECLAAAVDRAAGRR